MKEENKSLVSFWNIPILGVFLYVLTIVSQLGFNSYFGIPQSFIEASLRANILYFFVLFKEFQIVAPDLTWTTWASLVFIVGAIVAVFFLSKRFKKSMLLVSFIIALMFVNTFFKFGVSRAASQTNFLVPSSECADSLYIIPIIYDGRAVMIPISENNKLKEGFVVRDIAGMACKLVRKEVGLVKW